MERSRAEATYVAGLCAQLVEAQAILDEADEGVGLDVGSKWKRVRVPKPASRQVEGGITKPGFLKISPY